MVKALSVLVGFLVATSALAQTQVRVALNFVFDGSNAAFFLAEARGYYGQEGLNVTLDSTKGSVDAATRLASGNYDAGFLDMSVLTEFNSKNAGKPLRAVAAVYDKSPFAVISLRKTKIDNPAALKGKTIGAPVSDAAYRLFPTFARAASVDPKSITWKHVDINLREVLLLRGEADAIVGFDSTAYFNLKRQGVKIEDVQFLRYTDYGLDLYGNALVAHTGFMEKNPTAVRGFVRASLRGWMDAIKEPAAAIDALLKRDNLLNKDIELEKLQWLIRHQIVTQQVKDNGIGAVDRARLDKMIATVTEAFLLPSKLNPDEVYTDRFLPTAADRRVR